MRWPILHWRESPTPGENHQRQARITNARKVGEVLKLPNGVPSKDCFRRVLSLSLAGFCSHNRCVYLPHPSTLVDSAAYDEQQTLLTLARSTRVLFLCDLAPAPHECGGSLSVIRRPTTDNPKIDCYTPLKSTVIRPTPMD